MKSGQRQMKVANDKKVKKHIKGFYDIVNKINTLAEQLDPEIEYTEDNINDYVKHITGRDLDPMEKFLLLGKLQAAKEVINNIEVKHESQDNI